MIVKIKDKLAGNRDEIERILYKLNSNYEIVF